MIFLDWFIIRLESLLTLRWLEQWLYLIRSFKQICSEMAKVSEDSNANLIAWFLLDFHPPFEIQLTMLSSQLTEKVYPEYFDL